MVVDDDANDRLLIEEGLKAAGTRWPIAVLTGGAEAIAYLKGEGRYGDRKEHPYPAFVITDLKMVPVDGLEILLFLRSTPRAPIVPTIVFSSSSDPDDIQKAYSLGASSYHVKSATSDGFAAQLKALYEYWMTCDVPEVDNMGVWLATDSRGRIGERFSSDLFAPPRSAGPPATPGTRPPFRR